MSEALHNRALAGTFWAYVQNWAGRGLSLVVFLVLARLLNPLDFGVFAIALVLLTLAEVLVEQGLAHAIVQRHEIDALHLSTAFWVTLAAGLLLAFGAVAAADALAVAFDHPEIAPLIRALSPAFVLMALSSVPAALLRRELDYKQLAKRTAASNLVSGIVAIWLAARGAEAWTFVGQLLTFQLVGAVVLWRHESWRPTRNISLPHLRQLAGFSGKVTLGKLLEFVETRVVDLVVGSALGLVALGSYSLAFRANQAVTQLLAAPLWDSALGTFARLQRDPRAMRAAYVELSNFSSIAIVPVFIFLAAAAPRLIPALLGEQWTQSIVAFQVLAVLGVMRTLIFLNGSLLQATGMAGAVLMLAGVRVVLTLVCLFLLLRFGVPGVTLALLIGQALVIPMYYRIMKTRHDFGTGAGAVLHSLGKPLFATAAALAAAMLAWDALESSSPLATLLGAAVWLATYFLVLLLIMPRTLAGYARRLPGAASGWLLLLAGTVVRVRESVGIAVLDRAGRVLAMLGGPRKPPSAIRQVLVVPPDLVDVFDGLGDQALLGGLRAGLEKRGVQRMLILCQKDVTVPARSGMEVRALRIGRSWRALPTLIREMRNSAEVVILGADTLDGYYSRFDSLLRFSLARLACRLGIPCVIVSASFNDRPDPATVTALRDLPDGIMLCARDAVSAGRIARLTDRSTVCAADLGFLLQADMNCRLDRALGDWCAPHRHAQRPVIGWNMSAHSLQLLRPAQRDAAIAAGAVSIRRLMQWQDAAVVLIPHDFRSGCGDQEILSRLASELADLPGDRLLRLTGPYSASEIKAACRHLNFLMTGRMHLMIAALGMGVPAVGVEYQGKFSGLLQHFGLSGEHLISPAECCDAEALYSFVAGRFLDRAATRVKVRAALPGVVAKAELNFSGLPECSPRTCRLSALPV